MFNHSEEPNVVWQRDLDRLIVVYTAERDIQDGEELCLFILLRRQVKLTKRRIRYLIRRQALVQGLRCSKGGRRRRRY